MTDANSFLMGGASTVKFEDVGDTVMGVIIKEPEVTQQRDFKTQEPAWWDAEKTQPKEQLVVTLRTKEADPDDPDDDGERRLFVASQNMKKAIAGAVRNAKKKGLAVGGVLKVTFIGEGEKDKKRGGNPPKLYTAQYFPPKANEVSVPEQKQPEPEKPAAAQTPDDLPPEAAEALQQLFSGS